MRQDTALVRRRGKFETCGEHAPVAQRQEVSGLEPEQCQFESDPAHHFAHVDQPAGVAALKARTVFVRIEQWAPHRGCGGNGYATGLTRFNAGSTPVARTIHRSLRQAAKASGLHPDIRRFESVSEHHASLAQRQSTASTLRRQQARHLRDAPSFGPVV
jgi:hypothetical protein